jgi:hypothetical protein
MSDFQKEVTKVEGDISSVVRIAKMLAVPLLILAVIVLIIIVAF